MIKKNIVSNEYNQMKQSNDIIDMRFGFYKQLHFSLHPKLLTAQL